MGRYDDLERLAKLHSEGVLSDEEFAHEKARLLAQSPSASSSSQQSTASTRSADPGATSIKASKKSRLVTLLLCLFLGNFGLHRLYLRRTRSALVMALLAFISVFSCVKVFKTNMDMTNPGSVDSGWEYFGEMNFENGKLLMNGDNIKPFASVIFINFVINAWRFIDLILILLGQFRDANRRLVLKW